MTTLHLSALYSTQAGAHETLVGAAMQFSAGGLSTVDNPVSFYGGLWMRLGDAIIPYVGLEYQNLRFGFT